MKVLIINTVYNSGSVGKICAALYRLSSKAGMEPIVGYGRGDIPQRYSINGIRIGDRLDFYNHVLFNFTTGKNAFASKRNTTRFLNWLDNEQPDIIHIHNLHGFYIHVGLFFEYIKRKQIPVVWTLHDCWPITGNCAFFEYIGCTKWQTGCFNCPIHAKEYPYAIFRDNSKENYLMKKNAFTEVEELTIVTPSNWLAGIVKLSFLNQYPIIVLPNGIDLDTFSPIEPEGSDYSQKINNLCGNMKIILGVANYWDARKGLEYMLKLAENFNADTGHQIVLIGLSKRQCRLIRKRSNNRIITICRTNDQAELAAWYRSASVFVNPTLQDNFPTTNLEALACGTPVVTFQTGGSPESLTADTGIVVPKGDFPELRSAIDHIFDSISEGNKRYSTDQCREHALIYDQNTQFNEYIQLYKNMIHKVRKY